MIKRKETCVGVVITVLMIAHAAQGGISIVKNGSFENDGKEITNIATEAPLDWPDVSIPTTNFGGKMDTVWRTHSYDDGDGNSLTLYSKSFQSFTVGDEATVSQQVCLKDVNELIFDISLNSQPSPWDSSNFSAILRVDGNDVWDSKDQLPEGNDDYLNVTADINDKYIGDANSYTLSLVLRSNTTVGFQFNQYDVRWDFVKFDAYCGGFGYLAEDINRDCFVDFYDFAMLAGVWLEPQPSWEYNLAGDTLIDGSDLKVFADGWLDSSYWQDWQSDNCFEVGPQSYDLNEDGIVNMYDFAILAGDMAELDYDEVSGMAGEWLERSWRYGL